MTAAEFLKVLGETESGDNPNARLGDNGRALGRFQVHPDWVWTQCRRFGLQPALDETWDSFITRLVIEFFNHNVSLMDDLSVAMYFHIGHHVAPTETAWDGPYAERFQTFAANIAHP